MIEFLVGMVAGFALAMLGKEVKLIIVDHTRHRSKMASWRKSKTGVK